MSLSEHPDLPQGPKRRRPVSQEKLLPSGVGKRLQEYERGSPASLKVIGDYVRVLVDL